MQLLQHTYDDPFSNVALDEALLEAAEEAEDETPVLRLWEPSLPMVVVGRSSRFEDEVYLERCQSDGVAVMRRPSGGASIVTGPGCLMYAVVLSYETHPHLRMIDQAHQFVLARVKAALDLLRTRRPAIPVVSIDGTSDLVLGEKKFSGNSLRCKRGHLLYHGTLLYDYPLEQIPHYLRMPSRQPQYRRARSHEEFVTNLPVGGEELRGALIEAWQASDAAPAIPEAWLEKLLAEKFAEAGKWRAF